MGKTSCLSHPPQHPPQPAQVHDLSPKRAAPIGSSGENLRGKSEIYFCKKAVKKLKDFLGGNRQRTYLAAAGPEKLVSSGR